VTSASASLGGTSSTPEATACKIPFSLKRKSTRQSPGCCAGRMLRVMVGVKNERSEEAGEIGVSQPQEVRIEAVCCNSNEDRTSAE
jgi:hypothetical protein